MFKWFRKFERWLRKNNLQPEQPIQEVEITPSLQAPYLERPTEIAHKLKKTDPFGTKLNAKITKSSRIKKMRQEMEMDGLSEREIDKMINDYGQEGCWNAWQNTKRLVIPENEVSYIPGTVAAQMLTSMQIITELADIRGQ